MHAVSTQTFWPEGQPRDTQRSQKPFWSEKQNQSLAWPMGMGNETCATFFYCSRLIDFIHILRWPTVLVFRRTRWEFTWDAKLHPTVRLWLWYRPNALHQQGGGDLQEAMVGSGWVMLYLDSGQWFKRWLMRYSIHMWHTHNLYNIYIHAYISTLVQYIIVILNIIALIIILQ